MIPTLYLKLASSILFDLQEELSRLYSIISDESISTRTTTSSLNFLSTPIIPFVKENSKLLEASKIMSPIS